MKRGWGFISIILFLFHIRSGTSCCFAPVCYSVIIQVFFCVFLKYGVTKTRRILDRLADPINGTLTWVLSAVVGSHGAHCGLLIHWENKVLFMALLGQIHIFLNAPNLYWTWHWMNLCCATLGISKRTEYVFLRDLHRFECAFLDSSWVRFTIRSFTDAGTTEYWIYTLLRSQRNDWSTLLCWIRL